MKKNFLFFAVLILFAFFKTPQVLAAPGDPDTSFGSVGFVTPYDFDNSGGGARAVAIQPADGKIVVGGGGHDMNNHENLGLSRLNTDGSLDSSFGTAGKASLLNFGADTASLDDLSILPTGEILTLSTTYLNSAFSIVLARFTSTGALDTTFGGGDGISDLLNPSGDDESISMHVLEDGKILIGGYDYYASRSYILRFSSDGTLDTTFGTGGMSPFLVEPVSQIFFLWDFALQSDGKILIAGSDSDAAPSHVVLTRLTNNGTLDTSFGTNGYLVFSSFSGVNEYPVSLAILSDDSIVLGGVTGNGTTSTSFIARLLSTGALDTSFGTSGFTGFDFGGSNDELTDLALQTDGKIVASVNHYTNSASQFAAVRLNADGSMDSTFGTDGKTNFDYPNTTSAKPYALALQSDGKIVLAGSARDTAYHFGVTRIEGNNANIQISGSAIPALAHVGDTVTFTYTITNNGPNTSGEITFTDTLPSGLTYVSITPSVGSCTGTTDLSCNLGSLENGETATLTLIVTAISTTNTTNSASISATGPTDPDTDDNVSAIVLTITTAPSGGCSISPISNPHITSGLIPLMGLAVIESMRRLRKKTSHS